MAMFLLKTEPGTYGYPDLEREGRTVWSGVSNPAALSHIRSMRKGDEALIYHTGDEKAVVGLARVLGLPYADAEQPGVTARGEPKFAVVDIEPIAAAPSPVTLAALKADARFKDFALVRQPRLSVMPVPDTLARLLRKMAGL